MHATLSPIIETMSWELDKMVSSHCRARHRCTRWRLRAIATSSPGHSWPWTRRASCRWRTTPTLGGGRTGPWPSQRCAEEYGIHSIRPIALHNILLLPSTVSLINLLSVTANVYRRQIYLQALLRLAKTVMMPHNGQPTQVRVGLHTGTVVTGLIGTKLPKFSIFGDTMNTASRMESTCRPGERACAARDV